MYCIELISKNKSNPKKIWEIINFAIYNKCVNSPITNSNTENSVNDDLSKIADCFNQFFVEIGYSIANNVNKCLHANCTTYLKNPVLHFIVLNPPS